MAGKTQHFPALLDRLNRSTVRPARAMRGGGSFEPMTRIPFRLATCCTALLATGCFGFTAGVEEPDLTTQAAQVQSRIVPGTTTRPEVRARLGTPIFESPDWGVELYRSDQSDVSTDWLVILMVPVPGWTEVREYRLYPLIVYSSSDVVEGIGVGRYEEHHMDSMGSGVLKSPGGTDAEVLGFTLAVDACDKPACIWLVAQADRSVPLLRTPPAPGTCVMNLAKPDNGVEVALDDQTLLRSTGSGSGWGDSAPAEPWFARITVSPGTHTVRATPMAPSLAVAGELRQTIDCRGNQWFVVRIVRQFQKASSFLSRERLTGEVQVLDSPDAIPDDARLILLHNDRSLTASH